MLKKNTLEIANDFFETDMFIFSEPDFMQKTILFTNDPLYNDQWSLNNTGQSGGSSNSDIDIENAWQITKGREDIKIAVVDEGIDLTHPDLINKLLPGFDASGNGTNGGPVNAGTHGTNCAGIVGAEADNSIGIAGVANECSIIPVSFDVVNAFDSEVVDAIDWAWDSGEADVISNSWGRAVPSSSIDLSIFNASTLGRDGLGSVVLFAGGNENESSVAYPANLPSIIAVGATDMCDERWDPSPCSGPGVLGGSNRGTHLDIVAPGVRVKTTHNGGGYVDFTGTSAATPIAAGAAALVLSVNPCLTKNKVKQILELSCDKPVYTSRWSNNKICYANISGRPNGSWNNEMGYGRINVFKALKYASTQNIIVQNNLSGGANGSNGSRFNWVLLKNHCHSAASAVYSVYRYEVFRNITFPYRSSPYINVNATGFSAANPNDGSHWGQAVNVTNTSAKLRTFVYNVINSSGQSVGWIPNHPLDVRFHYSITDNVVPNIYLQNQTVSSGSNYYKAANEIWSGRNVTSAIPIGNYVVQGSANVDLMARNQITIKEGTIIDPTSGSFRAAIEPVATCSQYPMGMVINNGGVVSGNDVYQRYYTENNVEKKEISQSSSDLDFVSIYPNPSVDGKFNIELSNVSEGSRIEIMNLVGEMVYSSVINSDVMSIDLSNRSKGVFFSENNR